MIPAGSHGAHFYNANASTFTDANASSLPVSTRGLPWDVQSNFTISSNAAVSSGTPALALVDLGYNDTSSYVEFPTNGYGGIAFWGNKTGGEYYVAIPYYTVTTSTTGSCSTTRITGTCNTSLVTCPPPYYTTTQSSCYCSGCVAPCYQASTSRSIVCNYPGQTFAIGNCTYTCTTSDAVGQTIVRYCYAVSCTQTITCSANTCTGSGCIPTGCACGVTYATTCDGPSSTCSGAGCVPSNCCQGSGATGGPITSFTATTAYRDFGGDVNVTIDGGASFRVRFAFDSSITGPNKYKSTTTLLTSGNGYFVGQSYTLTDVYAATDPNNTTYQDGAVIVTITGVSGGGGTAPSGITYTTTSTYTTGVRILRYANGSFTQVHSKSVGTSSSSYRLAKAMRVVTDGKEVSVRLYSEPNASWRTSTTNSIGSTTYNNSGIVLNTSVGLARPTGIGSASSTLDNYEVDTGLK